MTGKGDAELPRFRRDSEVSGSWDPGIRLDEIRATGSVPLPGEDIDRTHAVFFVDDMTDEARPVHRSVHASADHQARADFAPGRDVRLPPQCGIDVVAHVARTGDTVGDHARARDVGENVHEAVHVHVPEPWNEKPAPPVDDAGTGWNSGARRGADESDAITGDEHRVIGTCRA